MQSLRYDEVIGSKSDEISRLKSVNSYFKDEFDDVNDKLKKVSEYLNSATGENHKNVKETQQDNFRKPRDFKEEDLSRRDKHTLNQIKEIENQLSEVQMVAHARVKKIESAINLTGLNIKKKLPKELTQQKLHKTKEISLNNKRYLMKYQGGPIEENTELDNAVAIKASKENEDMERHLQKLQFTSEFDYLIVLEKMVNLMPLSRPMKNYYVSSGFGFRTDPITRRIAAHRGLDFVGVKNAKIISPSRGKVILAGQFSNYGNAVVIDHGFGITTRYGHLSAVKVKEGQIVNKGDIIALQGNTGRSTGSHLHYEVRYKNIPLNPKKFLEAGEALLNNDKTPKYVNS